MNSYNKALSTFNNRKAQRVAQALKQWATTRIGRVVVPNMTELERFLPKNNMCVLLNTINAFCTSPIIHLQEKYLSECYKNTATGGEITSSPEIVGKVMERESFSAWLFKTYPKHFIRKKYAEDFIDELLSAQPVDKTKSHIFLGSEFLIWVTWNEIDTRSSPFHFIKFNMAEEARSCLGLEPQKGKRLLLFTYERPKDMILLRPTIADAGLFTFFQPPPEGHDDHGWTRPWEPSFLSPQIKKKDKNYELIPRPEAIHKAEEACLGFLIDVKQLL